MGTLKKSQNTTLAAKKVASAMYILIAVIYGTYILWAYVLHTEAIVPDEESFWNIMGGVQCSSVSDYLRLPNTLGYGSGYWLFGSILHSLAQGNMILPRLVAALALFSSIAVTFLLAKKFFRYSFLQIILLLTITFSSPVIWFTGKIIGPEILGQSICITGTALSLFAYKHLTIPRDEQDGAGGGHGAAPVVSSYIYILGFLFMGIAASFKAYYIVFAVFTGVYVVADRLSSGASVLSVINQIVLCGLAALAGFAAGYIIGCPYLLYDSMSFRENLGTFTKVRRSDPAGWLRRILGSDPQMSLAWDLVNYGGLSHFIISLPVLMLLLCLGIIDKSSRVRAIAATAAILSQVYLCFFGSTFLGWYLMPVIFFAVMAIPSESLSTKFKKPQIAAAIVVLLLGGTNLLRLREDLSYQISSKNEAIYQMSIIDQYRQTVDKYTEMYPDYTQYPLIEPCVLYPGGSFYVLQDEKFYPIITYISNRALNNSAVRLIYEQALAGENGRRLIAAENNCYVIYMEHK